VPEHQKAKPAQHAAQPGCFTTAVTIGAWPFFALDLVESDVFASAVTGSSGSGRTPVPGTHHPERNGNRSLEEIVHHVGTDHLVGWAWAPGAGRQPAPGTQAQVGALLDEWVKNGAVCPN